MNKLRNGLIVAAAVGAGAAYVETQTTSNSQKVAAAQHQIVATAKRNAAHPPSPNADGGMAEYNASGTAQDAKAISAAKKLTARKVARLSFNKAFNEASNIGGMVIDVSDMTGLPVKTVLNETLPKSTVTALDKKNIHFTYNSEECNPMSMAAQGSHPAEGWIPLSVSNKPEAAVRTRFANSGEIYGKAVWGEYRTSNGDLVWGRVGSKPKPQINTLPPQNTVDGSNITVGAMVSPGKAGDHIKSASLSLVDPHRVPKGVSLGKSRLVHTNYGEAVVARFTDPSDPSLQGQVEVRVNAVESNGATAHAEEPIPYSKQPMPPSQ